MSRTNIVKCKTEQEKKDIAEMWYWQNTQTKKSFAKGYNISTRTLNRILDEFPEKNKHEWDYTLTKNELTIFCDGEHRSITKGYPKFNRFKRTLIEADFCDEKLSEVYDLLDLGSFVETFSKGNLTVNHEEGKVFYGSFEIKNSLSDHMLKMLDNGEDVEGFVKFSDMLLSNPKEDIVEELYGFMKHNKITIDEDGYIIAYKGVRPDYKDYWTGTIDNSVGAKPRMPASQVEHNPKKACGAGLHAGSLKYATDWARDGHVMIVKIHPAMVCSVPWDCDSQKIRTCGYDVEDEV